MNKQENRAENRPAMSILLVEDDEIDRRAIRRAFRASNIDCEITEAMNGADALAILNDKNERPRRPYLVLLDINMPKMSGIDFLKELRSAKTDPAIRDSVVFVLTTSAAEQDRAKAYEHHVAGYIVKPDYTHGLTKVVSLLDTYNQLVEFP